LNIPFDGEGKRRRAEQARRLNIKEKAVCIRQVNVDKEKRWVWKPTRPEEIKIKIIGRSI
jgi:hypothetical protein